MQSEHYFNGRRGAGLGFSLLMVVYALVAFVGQLLLSLVSDQNGLLVKSLSALFSIVALIIVLTFFCVKRKQNFFTMVSFKKFNPIYVAVSLLLVGGMFFGLGFLNYAIKDFFVSLGLKVNQNQLALDGGLSYAIYIVVLAVLPAVFEEFFFRGFLLANERDGSRSLKTIILPSLSSAVLFALYHGSLFQLVYQFIFGLGFGLLSTRSGSVIPSTIAHFINNFLIITFTYFGVVVNFYGALEICLGLTALLAFALVIVFYKPKNNAVGNKSSKTDGIKYLFLFASVGIIICLALIVGNLFV